MSDCFYSSMDSDFPMLSCKCVGWMRPLFLIPQWITVELDEEWMTESLAVTIESSYRLRVTFRLYLGLSRREEQCLATWWSTGLSFCPSRSGHVAGICIDNFWPACPPALGSVQEVKEKVGLLSYPATLLPAKLMWICLHILKKGLCSKGRGRQARECSSVTTVSWTFS